MKRPIIILLAAELFIAYFVFAPTCILRRDAARSFAAWRDNPTLATQAECDRQQWITALHSLGFSAAVFGVMAGATLLAVRIFTDRHSDTNSLNEQTQL